MRKFLPYIILASLKRETLSIYELMHTVGPKFDIVLSAGSVYAITYSLERKGYIKRLPDVAVAKFTLTSKGEVLLETAKAEIPKTMPQIIAYLNS